MTLSLSKAYTPSSGQVTASASYNTDIAALFNAFSGLEAQTSTLGGLTITPTADSTTKFNVTNAAGTSIFAVDTTNSHIKLPAASRLYLGATVYITEASNVIKFFSGATEMMSLAAALTTLPLATTLSNAAISMTALPTSDPSVTGQLWNDSGTIKVSA